MTRNPILDEIRATREQILAEAGGTIKGLVAQLQEGERHSGHEILNPIKLRQDRAKSEQTIVSLPTDLPANDTTIAAE